MCNRVPQKTRLEAGSLDTLAQLRQAPQSGAKLAKRARAKYMGLPLVKRLTDLDSPLEASYRNSIYCCNILEQCNGEITSHYCKNRWCIVCSRIRIAQAINKYMPVVESWEQSFFVTLTIPNVTTTLLRETIDTMLRVTWRTCWKRLQRAGLEPKALRKLEVTYNASTNTYHPHLHVLINGYEAAKALRDAWLDRNPSAVAEAQDIRPADEESLYELFKYFTKLVDQNGKVSPEKLDIMFQAMRGRRVFQPLGFSVPKAETVEESFELEQQTVAFKRVHEHVVWQWDQEMHDWIDQETGEVLTGYEPGGQDRAFVEATTSDGNDLADSILEPLSGEIDALRPSEALENGYDPMGRDLWYSDRFLREGHIPGSILQERRRDKKKALFPSG